MTRGTKVVICGPSRLVRQTIRRHLETISPDIRVVAEAPSVHGAIILTRQFAPHLVVVAGSREGDDPSEVVRTIRAATPEKTRVVLVPERPIGEVPEAAAVLPRSRYTNRALVAVLGRLIARL